MPSTSGAFSPRPTPLTTPPHSSSDRKNRRSQTTPWSNWMSKALRYTFTQTTKFMPSTATPSIVLSSTEHAGTNEARPHRVILEGTVAGPPNTAARGPEDTGISSENSRISSYHVLWKWSSWAAFATICGFIINAAIIHPTFQSAKLARESLDLDEWTALKNYNEYCQNVLKATNYSSFECSEALSKPLPPPPSFLTNLVRRLTRRFMRSENGSLQPRTSQPLLPPLAQYLSAGMKSSGIFVWVILVNVFFVVFLKALNCSGDVRVFPFWAIMLCLIWFDVPIGEEDSSWWTILMTGISMVIAICYCTS